MSLTQIKTVIFDVNGVLIDSNRANAQAMARAFTEDPETQRRIVARYLELTGIDRGSKIRIVQEEVIGRPFAEFEYETRWENFTRHGRESMLAAPVVSGVPAVLAAFGALGIRRAALSNTPLRELRGTLGAHGLENLLDIVRGGGDWPKSESLLRLLEEFDLVPSDCLFFGDGKGDLAAARAAGVPFIAIDAGRGEFAHESGYEGPYADLTAWARASGLLE